MGSNSRHAAKTDGHPRSNALRYANQLSGEAGPHASRFGAMHHNKISAGLSGHQVDLRPGQASESSVFHFHNRSRPLKISKLGEINMPEDPRTGNVRSEMVGRACSRYSCIHPPGERHHDDGVIKLGPTLDIKHASTVGMGPV